MNPIFLPRQTLEKRPSCPLTRDLLTILASSGIIELKEAIIEKFKKENGVEYIPFSMEDIQEGLDRIEQVLS